MIERTKRNKHYLDELLIYLKINSKQFATNLGFKVPTKLYHILHGRNGVSHELAKLISEKYNEVNYEWLLTGKGKMLNNNDYQEPLYTINNKGIGVPYFDIDWRMGFDSVMGNGAVQPSYYIDFKKFNSADGWGNATGDSMAPIVSHGDIVAIRRLENWETYILYGEMYGIITEEYMTIKYVRKSKKGDEFVLLVPENPKFDEQDIPKIAITAVFQIMGCAKKIF